MHCRKAITVAALAASLSACSSTDTPATVAPSSPSTTTTTSALAGAPSAPAVTPVNDSTPGVVEFKRADTGAALGTATIAEVKRLPATCASDPVGANAQLVAVHAIITSTSDAKMPRPDMTTLIPVDDTGTTYEASQAILTTACQATYPEPGPPVPGGTTNGWSVVAVPVAATEVRYYPIISDGTGFVKPAPLYVSAKVPA